MKSNSVSSWMNTFRKVGILFLFVSLFSNVGRSDENAPAKESSHLTREEKLSQIVGQGLSDPDPNVRKYSVGALVNMGQVAVPVLLDMLENKKFFSLVDTVDILWALGEIGDKSASSVVAEYLFHPDAGLRESSIRALGKIGDHSVVPDLVKVLRDDVFTVRLEAATALGKLGGSLAAPFLVRYWLHEDMVYRNFISRSLGRMGAPAQDSFLRVLQNEKRSHWQIRFYAVRALGVVGEKKAEGLLIMTALNPKEDTEVRSAAFRALGIMGIRLGGLLEKSYSLMMESLRRERKSQLRVAAAWAFGMMGQERFIKELEEAFVLEENPSVQDKIQEALDMIYGPPPGESVEEENEQ